MIELAAAKNKLDRVRTELLTTGSVGVYDVRFRFDGAWDGLDRIAVFRAGGESVSIVLGEDNACQVPWEVLTAGKKGCPLYAGVYGTSGGEEVLPTIWARLGTIRAGTETGELAQDPTPDALQQVLSQTLAERNAAEAAAERAEAAAETALAAAAGVAEDEEVEEMLGEIYPAREETEGG